jgi:hypothetical protein
VTRFSCSVSCQRIGIGLCRYPGFVAIPYQSDARLCVSTETLSGSQAALLDRHALQMRWAFESLSKARPQLRQRTRRMPPGHRLTEWRNARHFRCAISPCSRMRYAPRAIGPEQMGHIGFGVAMDLPLPAWEDRFHAARGLGCSTGRSVSVTSCPEQPLAAQTEKSECRVRSYASLFRARNSDTRSV